ncbi:MAG: thiolase family protein, partial [Smithellaceae bacterium]
VIFDMDDGVRWPAKLEDMAKLKSPFKAGGSCTAGNSSQMTDGAAFSMLMTAEKAQQLGLKPLAKLTYYAVAGCRPEEMGIGPSVAIPKVLKMAGLTTDDIELFEINEAFASQAIYSCRKIGIEDRYWRGDINPNGGAIALGHPLGCTGAKLTAQLLHEMKRRGAKRGIVSMCIGGGMGAAGIYEML